MLEDCTRNHFLVVFPKDLLPKFHRTYNRLPRTRIAATAQPAAASASAQQVNIRPSNTAMLKAEPDQVPSRTMRDAFSGMRIDQLEA